MTPLEHARRTDVDWKPVAQVAEGDVLEAHTGTRYLVQAIREERSLEGHTVFALRMLSMSGDLVRTTQKDYTMAVAVVRGPFTCEQCETTQDVRVSVDPYRAELADEQVPMALCPDCYDNRADDI